MFLAFGTMFVTCGFTHMMEAIVLWKPWYWFSGDLKLVTGVASVITAVTLPSIVPQIEGMVVVAQVSEERKKQLEISNQELAKRELELSASNRSLQKEIDDRELVEERLRVLSRRLLTLQDDERQRVFQMLHEGTLQSLTALQLSLARLRRNLREKDDLNLMTQADQLAMGILDEVRNTSYLLYPPMLEEAGLIPALGWYADAFTKLTRVEVEIVLPQSLGRLGPEVEIGLFRIVQESLTNVNWHARATKAVVEIAKQDDLLALTIRDNGVGLPSDFDKPNRKSIGISGMTERARQLGAELKITRLAPGTMVQLLLKTKMGNGSRTFTN